VTSERVDPENPEKEAILDPKIGALIEALPKAELHVHLEGSVLPALALGLAARRGVTLPGAERGVLGLREAYRFTGFSDFIAIYVGISNCLQQAEDFAEAVVGIGEELARQRVRWVEMTFTPMTHVIQGVDPDAMLAGLAEGRRRARTELGVEFAWVFDVVRSFPDQAEGTLELALRGRDLDEGVIALGVGGPEGPSFPVDALAPVFARARALGLHSVPHAGEQDGSQSMWANLKLLQADRLGHGVRCLDDPKLVDHLREHQIPLEVCPSSNVVLGFAPNLAAHPLPELMRQGLEVSLNSDDPPLFGTTLNEEYRRCAASFGWSAEQVVSMAGAAVRHSFMPAVRKAELLAEQAELLIEHAPI